MNPLLHLRNFFFCGYSPINTFCIKLETPNNLLYAQMRFQGNKKRLRRAETVIRHKQHLQSFSDEKMKNICRAASTWSPRREILIPNLITVLFDHLFPSRYDKLLRLSRKRRTNFVNIFPQMLLTSKRIWEKQ